MVQRYPYEPMGEQVFADGHMGCRFRRVDLDQDFGISEALMAFFTQHGRCARCDGPLRDWGEHEACSPSSRRFYGPKSDIELLVLNEVFQAHWKLRVQESRWRESFKRKRREKFAAGSRTREEVRTLLELQEHRCYYCFGSLEGPGGSVNGPDEPITYHEDHYVSLRWGGSHSISNIVLACVDCNSRKRDMHGDDFVRDSLEQVSRAARKGLLRIHQARANHPSRLVVVADPAEDEPDFIVSAGETGEP